MIRAAIARITHRAGRAWRILAGRPRPICWSWVGPTLAPQVFYEGEEDEARAHLQRLFGVSSIPVDSDVAEAVERLLFHPAVERRN